MTGYKAIKDKGVLRIAPLTILSGVNSSGKSSFMQPFLMMKQTLDSAFDPGPLLIHGPNVKNNDYTQMFSRGKSRTGLVSQFSAGMQRPGSGERELTFSAGPSGIELESDRVEIKGHSLTLKESLSDSEMEDLSAALQQVSDPYMSILGAEAPDPKGAFGVYRNRCFLEPYLEVAPGGRKLRVPLGDQAFGNGEWVRLLRGIIHVPGLRGNPERTYQRSAVGSTYPGTFETYAASIVFEWGESGDERLARLGADLERLGLTWKVRAKRVNDASIELQVARMPHSQQGGANDLVNVVDVGFGVSQTLPVLVALRAARRDQIVYVEQPEIHLHPKAQFEMAQSLVDAANRGVYVIVETHSSLLIRGVQVAVAKRQVRPGDVSMNWFSRDAISGFQKIDTANLDSQGRFGDWPLDFDDVARAADWSYLDAIAEGGA